MWLPLINISIRGNYLVFNGCQKLPDDKCLNEKMLIYRKYSIRRISHEYLTRDQLLDVLNGTFCIAICLLDSDYEYEYITGLKMLDKLLPVIYPDNEVYVGPQAKVNEEMVKLLIERLEKTVERISGWDNKFPGIFALVTRVSWIIIFISNCNFTIKGQKRYLYLTHDLLMRSIL